MTNGHDLRRCSPESQGISSASILTFVNAVEKQINELHSLMLLRHGAVVAEGWWSPYAPNHPHMLFSLSKSFTSTAIGLAAAEKRLSIEDRVLSFFPENAPARVSKNLDAMRVRHLLSMSTGHAVDTTEYMFKRRDHNWAKAVLAQPVKFEPGTHFLYNTGATYLLSAIVQKVTGLTLLEYLGPRLLEPLGIKGTTWEMSPQDICTGGFGMSIKTEDIARFGQMYLQKGVWNGQRLVPEAWIEEATSRQISNEGNGNPDWSQGYGYQFWRCRHGAYRGDGAFGQYCIVMPEQDAVLAITSGVADMQAVLDLVWEHLLPAMGKTASLPAQARDYEKLTHKLGNLVYLPPKGQASSPVIARISGKTFAIEPNDQKIKALSFDFSGSGCSVTVRTPRDKHLVECGAGVWHEGTTRLFSDHPLFGAHSCTVASGVWSADNTFVVTVRLYETPFIHTLACHFTEDRLVIDGAVNVGFGPTTYSLAGRIEK